MKVCFFGTFDKQYSSNKIILDGLHSAGVEVLEINVNTRITSLNKPKDLGLSVLLQRVINKFKLIPLVVAHYKRIKTCDVIFVGYPGHFDLIFAIILSKMVKAKLVFYPLIILYITFTEDIKLLAKHSLRAKILKIFEKIIYSFPEIILADIPFQKSVFQKLFNITEDKIKNLPIGADKEIYQYAKQKKHTSFNVVYYGLYSPIHGVEHIIKAGDILKNYSDIKFIMVGRGQTYDESLKLATDLKLKNVTFYNNKSEKDSLDILRSADAFLGFIGESPTIHRVLPNKVYQGLALGRTVISADSAATRAVFTDRENVYLCTPASSESLAEAILALRNNPELNARIAENGYKLFLEKYSPLAIGTQLKTIFQGVLGQQEHVENFPSLTIGIPTYEAKLSLVKALHSIYRQKYFDYVKKILLVVDGNSIEKSILKSIRNEKLEIVYKKKRAGQSTRINDIFSLADTDYLFLTNDDVVLEDNCLKSIFASISNSNKGLFSCNVRPVKNKSFFQKVIRVGFVINYEIAQSWNKGDNYLTCNGRGVVLAKKLYKKIVVPTTIWNNDAFLFFANRMNGYSSATIPDAIVRYMLPSSIHEHIKQSSKFLHSFHENKQY
ncbi:MAG: glycosyltransferase, partial [bacterium]|nr:glycosyltransferase [bacterium]